MITKFEEVSAVYVVPARTIPGIAGAGRGDGTVAALPVIVITSPGLTVWLLIT